MGRSGGGTIRPPVAEEELGSLLTSLIRGHHSISAAGRNLLVPQLGSLGEGMTWHLVVIINVPTVVERADQKYFHRPQLRAGQTEKEQCT